MQTLPQGIQLFLKNAESMAKDIIKPTERFYEGSTYQPYYHTPSYYYHYDSRPGFLSLLFPQRHVVHHIHHTPSKKSEKKEKEQAVLALGAALVVASGAMLYTFAAEFSKRSNAIEDIRRFERDRQIAHLDLQSSSLTPMQSYELEHIAQLQKEILTTYKTDAEVKLALKGAVAAGLIAGVGSCMQAYFDTPYKTLAITSAILTLGGGLGWTIKSGLDSTSLAMKRKAQDLLSMIQNFEYQSKVKV